MKRLILASVAMVVLVAAAQPSQVAPVLTAQGFFIEPGSDADPAAVENAVEEARFAGGRLSVAVLAVEPSGGATVFAENTLDETGGTGTVFTVAPETVGWASEGDIYTRVELDDATEASLDGSSDTEVVEIFVATLIGEPVGSTAPSGGGLPWGWIVVVLILAGGALIVWAVARSSKRGRERAIASARAGVKERLDDVANDIIELEDEVAMSADEEVRDHYESATAAYADAIDAYDRATSPQTLMATAEELDTAIWELDCVEALLDGAPLPAKPEKPKPTAPPRAASPGLAQQQSASDGYRRSNRHRKSGTAAMMTGLLLGSMTSPRRGARRSAGFRSGSRSPGGSRMRGGGRRRG